MVKRIISIFFISLLVALIPARVLALSEDYQKLFNREIFYFDPASDQCVAASGSLPTDVPEPYRTLFPEATAKFNVSPALISAIFIIENNGIASTAAGTWIWPPENKDWPLNPLGYEGPFQFGGEHADFNTWAHYGVDGDKDGDKDINDLVDAAYGAANLLAANGGVIGAPEGTPGESNYRNEPSSIRSAIWNYNHSDEYVETVVKLYKELSGKGGAASAGCTTTGTWLWPIEPTNASSVTACWKDWRGYYHAGLDIAAPAGTHVVASDGGTVIFSDFVDGYGETIVIDHNNGYWTLYGHMLTGTRKVRNSDKVSKGQHIGDVGSTGSSTGNHLHFNLQDRFIPPSGIGGNGEETINPLTNGLEIPNDVPDQAGCKNYPDGGRNSPSF